MARTSVDRDAGTRLVWALRRAFLAVEADKEQQLRPSGLNSAQYGVLINVHQRPGMNGADLARASRVTPQNVANLVRRLVERELIERHPRADQRHLLELHLTDAGRETLAVADRAVTALDSRVTQALGERDAATLRRLLDTLLRELPDTAP